MNTRENGLSSPKERQVLSRPSQPETTHLDKNKGRGCGYTLRRRHRGAGQGQRPGGGSDSGLRELMLAWWGAGGRMKGQRARWGRQERKPTAHLSFPAQTGSLSCLKVFVSVHLVQERSNVVWLALCVCLLGKQSFQPTSWTI